jgi:hypothetical protein
MDVRVECYSGRKGDERPVRFHLGEREYMVEEILDQWYGPEATYFKLRADDGNHYILSSWPLEDRWQLDSFRKVSP